MTPLPPCFNVVQKNIRVGTEHWGENDDDAHEDDTIIVIMIMNENTIAQVKSQRHSDCSDQYSVLGDVDHLDHLEHLDPLPSSVDHHRPNVDPLPSSLEDHPGRPSIVDHLPPPSLDSTGKDDDGLRRRKRGGEEKRCSLEVVDDDHR